MSTDNPHTGLRSVPARRADDEALNRIVDSINGLTAEFTAKTRELKDDISYARRISSDAACGVKRLEDIELKRNGQLENHWAGIQTLHGEININLATGYTKINTTLDNSHRKINQMALVCFICMLVVLGSLVFR